MLKPQDVNSPLQMVQYLLQNWLQLNSQKKIEGDEECLSYYFTLGGTNPVRLKASDRIVLCVHDYKKLWNYYSLTPPSLSAGKSLAAYALLFESCCLFFFEKRTICFVKWSVIYHSLVILLIAMTQPSMVTEVAVNCVSIWFLYWLYISCTRVYKVSILDDMLTTYTLKEENDVLSYIYAKPAVQTSVELLVGSSRDNIFYLLRSLRRTVQSELLHLFGYGNTGYMVVDGDEPDIENNPTDTHLMTKEVNTIMGSVRIKPTQDKCKMMEQLQSHATSTCQCAFFLLLNVGYKFLSSHTQSSVEVSKFARNALFISIIGMPIIFGFNFFSFLFGYTCAIPNSFGQTGWIQGMNCVSQYIFVYGTFGTISMFVMYTLITLTVVIALIGMLYGAIILHGLSTSWVVRYSGLRRVPMEWGGVGVIGKKGNNSDKHFQRWKRRQTDNIGVNDPSTAFQDDSMNGERDFRDFVQDSSDSADTDDDDDDMMFIDDATKHPQKLLCTRIRRDAYEHYLFIQEYVRQASYLWSPVIFVLIIVSFAIFAMCLFYTVSYSEDSRSMIGYMNIALLFAVIGTFPIYCLAYANAAVDTIRESFIYQSSPADFAVLGGRDQWVYYLNQSPAYWTVFGFPITWAVLYSVVGSVIGSIFIGVVTVMWSVINR